MEYSFEVIKPEDLNYQEYISFDNKQLYCTKEWFSFLQLDNSSLEPLFVRIMYKNEFVGYFTGAKFKKFGLSMIGSPFSGWTTPYMGLDLKQNFVSEIQSIYNELIPFLFTLNVHYIEISDIKLTFSNAENLHFKTRECQTYLLNINKDDDALFKQMKTDCRNFIRQFERRGATIEIAECDEDFANEYYDQLVDVFAKQGLVPNWSKNKVYNILNSLRGKNVMLCLRVRSPEGKSIASSIFLGDFTHCYYLAGASYREYQSYRPNEYMIWTAIKYWRDHGCTQMDMIGVRPYKKKFGPELFSYTKILIAKPRILLFLRDIAEWLFYKMTRVIGFFSHKS